MRKTYTLFSIVLLAVLSTSCNNMWMTKYTASMGRNVEEIVDDVAGDLPAVDGAALQTKLDDAKTHKDELFAAAKFDSWVIYMTDIDKENVADYTFGEGAWTPHGAGEIYTGGPNIGNGQLNASWNLTYYRYKTRKDRWTDNGEQHFDPALEGNGKTAEERFLFFKFTGDAKANTKLNNSMLCVDTYTKFVFNYSEPGNIDTIFGNKVPQKWQDYADPNVSVGNNHTMAYSTPFYLYDPVGYVEASGKVVYYEWAKECIRRANYAPALHEDFTGVAERFPDKPGHSPYLPDGMSTGGGSIADEPETPIPTNTEDDETIKLDISVRANYIKNINMGGQKSVVPKGIIAVFGHKMNVKFGETGEEELLAHSRYMEEGYLASEMHTLVHGASTSNLNGGLPNQPTLTHETGSAKDTNFELSLDLRKYNRNGALKTTDEEIIVTPEAKFMFAYRKSDNSIIFTQRTKGLGKNVEVSGYKDWTVKVGNNKDFILQFKKQGKIVEVGFNISVTERKPPKPATLSVKAKAIKNISIGGQDYATVKKPFSAYNKHDFPVEYGIFNYNLQVQLPNKTVYETSASLLNTKKELIIDKKTSKQLNAITELSLKKPNGDIKFAVTLSKHDLQYNGWYTSPMSLSILHDQVISTDTAKIILAYDATKKTYSTPRIDGALPANVTCELPSDFELKADGKTKDFIITYKVNNASNYCVGEVQVIYQLCWTGK